MCYTQTKFVKNETEWKRTKNLEFRRYFNNNPTKEEIRG